MQESRFVITPPQSLASPRCDHATCFTRECTGKPELSHNKCEHTAQTAVWRIIFSDHGDQLGTIGTVALYAAWCDTRAVGGAVSSLAA